MALVVQKYGGKSMGTIEKIGAVARYLLKSQAAGREVVVVVSAMEGETDRLIGLSNEITELPDLREYDSLISTGEQVSTSLLAIAIQKQGGKARSLLACQIPIYTDAAFKDARISRIETRKIRSLLKEGYIVVVAGFQGIDDELNFHTLGRGGSDTSAVAVAAALRADVCEIYSDVDGVYTTDPKMCSQARRLDQVSYEEVIELAGAGAKVMNIRAVEMAWKHNVPVLFKSSYFDSPGTLMTKGDKEMEQIVVSGVAYDKNECKITVGGIADRPGVAATLFRPLSDANIVVDMIIQNRSVKGHTDLTFTVRREDLLRAKKITEQAAKTLGATSVEADSSVAKVSIVGLGMKSHAGIASRMFETLSKNGINIQMISTSEIKISCIIDEKFGELAVYSLHREFELDKLPQRPAAPKKAAAKAGSAKGRKSGKK